MYKIFYKWPHYFRSCRWSHYFRYLTPNWKITKKLISANVCKIFVYYVSVRYTKLSTDYSLIQIESPVWVPQSWCYLKIIFQCILSYACLPFSIEGSHFTETVPISTHRLWYILSPVWLPFMLVPPGLHIFRKSVVLGVILECSFSLTYHIKSSSFYFLNS